MKIAIDLVHPAHVHVFRNAIKLWQKNGHEVQVTSRVKDCTTELLDYYEIKHKCISKIGSGLFGLLTELLIRNFRLLVMCLKFKPDVFASVPGLSATHVGMLMRKPALIFYDTEFAGLSNAISYPLASGIFTPECYRGDINSRQQRYAGFHELAYLHPKRFTPDHSVVEQLGITEDRYFIIRFVSWQASHDVNEEAISFEDKLALVRELSQHGRVLISSESPLPAELEQYAFSAHPALMHHVIAFASMLIGESATMASEAAMLGVPAVFIAKSDRGYTAELEEKYDLVHYFKVSDMSMAVSKVKDILETENFAGIYQSRKEKMLSEKIDVTEMIYKQVLEFAKAGRQHKAQLRLCAE